MNLVLNAVFLGNKLSGDARCDVQGASLAKRGTYCPASAVPKSSAETSAAVVDYSASSPTLIELPLSSIVILVSIGLNTATVLAQLDNNGVEQ